METLSEELLDQILSEVARSHLQFGRNDYGTLLSLSLVSRQIHRITEPHLYRSVVLQGHESNILRTLERQRAFSHHVKEVSIQDDFDFIDAKDSFAFAVKLLPLLPNLRELHINMDAIPISSLAKILELVSVETLRLTCVQAEQSDDWDTDQWSCTNVYIKTLDISFEDPVSRWEDCDDILKLAQALPNLSYLKVRNHNNDGAWSSMDASVFRCLVKAFCSTFQDTLLGLEFQYNDSNHTSDHVGIERMSDLFDACGILLRSSIEHIKTDTNCLLRNSPPRPRSLAIAPLCLPATLRKLYLRHKVNLDGRASNKASLAYFEESQCLAQLLTSLGKRNKFPVLETVTLAIFLPEWFAGMASTIVRRYARQKPVMKLILCPWFEYDDRDISKSWPKYNIAQDPRIPSYHGSYLQ
ncbi:hypothetical protein IQ07DRAFT_36823 [Pyrenochaeta sp. DS3sAY3a]|nr:hypothetical protein IQ07DRAFT_36823 [Pyrenochaeta sp. DS3sAY3a]